jgi:hypothetical protein
MLGSSSRFTAALAILLALGLPHAAGAQDLGRVVGRVLDAETGRGLVGAQVAVQGSAIGTLSGMEGRFILTGAPAGSRTLVVSYLGYASKHVIGVEIRAGAATSLDVALDPAAVAVEGITVSAERERGTTSRLLDEQRRAPGVVSAISAEQISRSTDGDAGAALQRVSGVTVQDGRSVFVRGLGERYTSVSLNGARVPSAEPDRRVVALDLFPAGVLQTITTSKSFTPDFPGDFSGAMVNIRTREFPSRRQTTFSTSLGYNPDPAFRTLPFAPSAGGEWLALGTGARAMPDEVRATSAPSPGEETNRIVNAFRNAWTPQLGTALPSSSLGFSTGGNEMLGERSVGYLVSGTYSAGHEASLDQRRALASEYDYSGLAVRQSVLLGGLLNLGADVTRSTRLSLSSSYNRSADNEARRESGLYENHGSEIRIDRLRYVERMVRSTQLSLAQQITPRQRLDLSVTTSGVERHEPDRSEFVLLLDTQVPTWHSQEGAFRAFGGLTDRTLEGQADYRLELGSTSRPQVLRIGGLVRGSDREAWDEGYAIRTGDWTESDPRWQAPPEEFFDGRYAQGDARTFEIGTYNAGGSYALTDRMAAGYAMVELSPAPRLQVVAGARVEHSRLVVDFQSVLGERGRTDPAYTDLLPALLVNLDLTRSQKLRFSASRTLARPEYREVVPFAYREGLGEDQVQGNADLERTRVANLDTRWELYPRPGELVAVALFAKRFEGPIERRYLARSGTNTLSFENAERGQNLGVELEFMRGLGFASEVLSPFFLFANATVMRSNVVTGREGDAERPMVGQAPYVFNTGLTWTGNGGSRSGTLLYNVVGPRIVNARPSGSLVDDVVEQPRPSLDATLRFPVWTGVSAKLDLKNLLDSPYQELQGEVVRRAHRGGRSASFGLSWNW